jgi:predicted porin
LTAGTNAPELYAGENVDVGPQRILRLNPRPVYFDVLLDSQVFYTDNANFADNLTKIHSVVFVNTIQALFAPPAMGLGPGKFAPTFGAVSQWYNYENNAMSPFDFEAQTIFFNGKYTLGKWQFGGGGNYTRLVNQSDYVQSYSELMPTLGVQRVFTINDNLLFTIGDQADYHFTAVPSLYGSRTDVNDRFDDAITFTLSWQMTRHLILQPYYRFEYSNYLHNTLLTGDRNDYLHTVGITLAYYFNNNVSLRVFFNYNRKQSDDPLTPAYHEYDGGLGASLDFKF